MADKRITDFTEAASAGVDYYLVTDSLSDGVKKIKPANIVPAFTGDVTKNAGDTVTTIADNAVTNTKAAQMAAGTIKSNLTGASANASDNTINAVMDTAFGSTQGAIAYRGASGWSSLAPGASGQFMQTSGPSANPIWQTIPGGGNMLSSTYDPTNKLTDAFNSANTVFLPAGTGAAARTMQDKAREIVTPEDFGAVGDGSTDDLSALQAARDYCYTTGAALRLGPHEYRVTGTLDLTDPIRIEGVSMMGSRIVSSSLNNDVIRITATAADVTGFELHNFTVDYTGKASSGTYGVRIRSLSGGLVYFAYITNIYVQSNAFGGVSIECGFWHSLNKIFVADVGADGIGFNFQGTGSGGVSSALTGNIFMSQCSVMHGTSATGTAGLVVDSWAEGLYIDHCTLENLGVDYGIWIRNSLGASYNPRNLFFDTMICDGNGKQGLKIDAALEINFSNCWFTTAQTGAGATITQAGSVTFTACKFVNNWQQGAYFNSSTSQVIFNGCVFDANGQQSVGTADAVYVDSNTNDFTINNCTFYRGIGSTKTQRYSVTVASGNSDRYIISHNNLFGYLTGALLDSGTGTNKVVTDNIT